MIDFENNLNNEQLDIVKSNCNLLLIACPGSGKTRTLTYKIIYELEKVHNTKQMVCAITYTNKAANEIKERIDAQNISTKQLWIGTIHAFCIEWILRPYYIYHSDLKFGFHISDPHDTEALLISLCEEVSEREGLVRRNDKITNWDCGYFYDSNFNIQYSCEEKKLDLVKEVISKYLSLLDEDNLIDFEGVLYYSLQILTDNPEILKILSNIFDFIMVDEFQDTKDIQYKILTSIARVSDLTCKLLLIGDPNQSIYSSLGGFPMDKESIEDLTECKFEVSSLDRNYRSSNKIIDFFQNFKVSDSNIVASGEHKDYKSLITYDVGVDNINLVNRIVELLNFNLEAGILESEICILAPQWYLISSITRNLIVAMPDNNFDGPGMTPFSRNIENFFYKLSRIGLTESSPAMFLRRLRWSSEVIYELSTEIGAIQLFSNRDFLYLSNSFETHQADGLLYLREYFEFILSSLKLKLEYYPRLVAHYEAFFNSSEARIARLKKDGIDYIGDLVTFRKVFKQRSGITVSTIHGVKGLEFDSVITFGLLQDYIPHFKDNDPVTNSSKLLYVASSRARKNLHLITEFRPYKKIATPVLSALDYNFDTI